MFSRRLGGGPDLCITRCIERRRFCAYSVRTLCISYAKPPTKRATRPWPAWYAPAHRAARDSGAREGAGISTLLCQQRQHEQVTLALGYFRHRLPERDCAARKRYGGRTVPRCAAPLLMYTLAPVARSRTEFAQGGRDRFPSGNARFARHAVQQTARRNRQEQRVHDRAAGAIRGSALLCRRVALRLAGRCVWHALTVLRHGFPPRSRPGMTTCVAQGMPADTA